jgi:hypothetical protein
MPLLFRRDGRKPQKDIRRAFRDSDIALCEQKSTAFLLGQPVWRAAVPLWTFTAVGTRCAYHATLLYPQTLAQQTDNAVK